MPEWLISFTRTGSHTLRVGADFQFLQQGMYRARLFSAKLNLKPTRPSNANVTHGLQIARAPPCVHAWRIKRCGLEPISNYIAAKGPRKPPPISEPIRRPNSNPLRLCRYFPGTPDRRAALESVFGHLGAFLACTPFAESYSHCVPAPRRQTPV